MKVQSFVTSSALLAALLTSSCSTTGQSDNQALSGFLAHYEEMERPESGHAAFWADSEFTVDSYDSVLIAEVQLWDAATKTHQGAGPMAEEDAGRLAGFFREKTLANLQEHGWKVVEEAGPRTIRLRMALTELDGASRFGNVLTSVPYMTTTAVKLMSAATDVHVFVGKASAELEITDALTGAVLAEAYDRRVGKHALRNIGSTWGDVEDALEVFAERIAEGLSKTND